MPPFWVMTGCGDTGWLGSCGARGDLNGKSARCHPGHHRDAVRIAVDGAIGPDDDRRVLGRDAVDGQLNGRRWWPAGGACTAVLVVDMTPIPSWWIGAREPGAVALPESPSPEHVLRSGRSDPHAVPRFYSRPERAGFRQPNIFTRASKY